MVPKGVLKACCVVDICPLIQYFYFYFVGEPSKVTGVKYVSMEFKGFASHFFFKGDCSDRFCKQNSLKKYIIIIFLSFRTYYKVIKKY